MGEITAPASTPRLNQIAARIEPESATRFLIDAGLASTMALDGDAQQNDEGKAGLFSAAERDDMAKFLLGIPFPPAQRRPYTNVLTKRAKDGFELFHIKGNHEGKPTPERLRRLPPDAIPGEHQHAGNRHGRTDLAWRQRPLSDPPAGAG